MITTIGLALLFMKLDCAQLSTLQKLASDSQKFYASIVGITTGLNGYEEYALAAAILRDRNHSAFRAWQTFLEAAKSGQPLVDDEGVLQIPPSAPAGLTLESTDLEVSRHYVRRYGDVVALIRSGNVKRAYDPRKTSESSDVYPEYPLFRDIGRVLSASAYVFFADGKTAEGTAILLDGLQFTQKWAATGRSAGYLVSRSTQGILLTEFDRLLEHLSEEDARQVLRFAQESLVQTEPFERAMENNRRWLSDFQVDWLMNAGDEESMEGELSRRLRQRSPGDRRVIGERARSIAIRPIDELIAVLKKPEDAWAQFQQTELPEVDTGENRLATIDDLTDAVAESIYPWFMVTFESCMRSRVQLRLLRLHARVSIFRWEHRRLPNNLSDVAPPAETRDPFSGQLFEFLPTGKSSYRLYSRGFKRSGEIELTYKGSGSAVDQIPPPVAQEPAHHRASRRLLEFSGMGDAGERIARRMEMAPVGH